MVRDSTLIRKEAKMVGVPRVYELTDKGIELSTKFIRNPSNERYSKS